MRRGASATLAAVAAFVLVAEVAHAGRPFASRVTIADFANNPGPTASFSGQVASQKQGCVGGRKVVVFHRVGRDVRYGKTTTDRRGDWKLTGKDPRPGAQEFYARVKGRRISAGICRGADSAIFKPCSAVRSSHDFDNGEWLVNKLGGQVPEEPFRVRVDGVSIGRTELLALSSRVPDSGHFPQVLVIASSGYLRIKSGADPRPPLPFGQSLVLGPAVFGTSDSFPDSTQLFFNPQIQRVDIETSALRRDCTGSLAMRLTATGHGLPPESTKTNQVMDLAWDALLHEPTDRRTRLDVSGAFTFTERVVPDPVRTAEFQSFRLVQVSSMFIDQARHDVDAFRFRRAGGPVALAYQPALANSLLPPSPSPLDGNRSILDSVQTDDHAEPNGDTPSYRIRVTRTRGPISGPLTPRAFFTDSQDLNDDNLGLWIHQRPSAVIGKRTTGAIDFSVVATADPLPAP